MTAIDWIRAHATLKPALGDTVEYDGATYAATMHVFEGRVPYRMRRELAAQAGALRQEEEINESLRIYEREGTVVYSRIDYEKI